MNAALVSRDTVSVSPIFGGHFEIDKRQNRLKEIAHMEAMEGFWDDADSAAKVQKEKAVLDDIIYTYTSIQEAWDEFEILTEFAIKDKDESSAVEAIEVYKRFMDRFNAAEQKVLLSDEADPNNAIITVNSGAGGTESCDWAFMLYRMIVRWAEKRKFKTQVLDVQEGETAGIKSATIVIQGPYAYGFLKSETGVHRLVRISPFDSNARRHTSFASIFVTPEVDDTIEIEILDKDLKIDVYRSGGAGGQSVNTTDSAVRITHMPSGVVVTCQNERSQLQNKLQAMKVLRSRLYEIELEKQRAKENEVLAGQKKIEWGSQIRSYVLHPYKLVKDHRTDYEVSSAENVLEGELDDFMDAYLRWQVAGQIAAREKV
jgi:peptide chain release factor 2